MLIYVMPQPSAFQDTVSSRQTVLRNMFSVSLRCIVQDNMCVGVRCTVFSNASFTKWVLGKQLNRFLNMWKSTNI